MSTISGTCANLQPTSRARRYPNPAAAALLLAQPAAPPVAPRLIDEVTQTACGVDSSNSANVSLHFLNERRGRRADKQSDLRHVVSNSSGFKCGCKLDLLTTERQEAVQDVVMSSLKKSSPIHILVHTHVSADSTDPFGENVQAPTTELTDRLTSGHQTISCRAQCTQKLGRGLLFLPEGWSGGSRHSKMSKLRRRQRRKQQVDIETIIVTSSNPVQQYVHNHEHLHAEDAHAEDDVVASHMANPIHGAVHKPDTQPDARIGRVQSAQGSQENISELADRCDLVLKVDSVLGVDSTAQKSLHNTRELSQAKGDVIAPNNNPICKYVHCVETKNVEHGSLVKSPQTNDWFDRGMSGMSSPSA